MKMPFICLMKLKATFECARGVTSCLASFRVSCALIASAMPNGIANIMTLSKLPMENAATMLSDTISFSMFYNDSDIET